MLLKVFLAGITSGLFAADLPKALSNDSLTSWRIREDGTLELQAKLGITPQVYLVPEGILPGMAVWVDVPGVASSPGTIKLTGIIREVNILRPNDATTRLEIRFAPGAIINKNHLRLIGVSPILWRMEFNAESAGGAYKSKVGSSRSLLSSQFRELSTKSSEDRLREREDAELANWKWFGRCAYRWSGWRLDRATGVRSTKKTCSYWGLRHLTEGPYAATRKQILGNFHVMEIHVNCSTLKVATPVSFSALTWDFPLDEDRDMVKALCDNIASPR
jgi:hypothetical protein